jgi:hypothetical protein
MNFKITSALDKNFDNKEIPQDWIDNEYCLDIIDVGRSAILSIVGDSNGRYLRTSTVEEIKIIAHSVHITTRNTVYILTPSEVA